MSTLTKTIRLHPTQQAFRKSNALWRGFVGGRGSGKTWIGAYDLLRRAKPGRTYIAANPTYRILEDVVWKTLIAIAKDLCFVRKINFSNLKMELGNGAVILGRSSEDPDRTFRGPNLSGVWLDEAGEMKEDAFDVAIACLREGGEQGWISATFTPRGRAHWTYKVFGSGKHAEAELFCSHTKQNPFLPKGFVHAIQHRYGTARAAQELGGQFVDLDGAEFDPDWFGDGIWFDDWPPRILHKVVALDPSKGKDAKTGDYSAFAIVAQTEDGTLWVEGDLDRRNVQVIVETALEINRTWKPMGFAIESNQFQELLAGEIVRLGNERGIMPPIYCIDNRVNKEVRIRRLAPWLSRGLIRFRNTPGTRMLVDQIMSFPSPEMHDDGPDALEMALRLLCEMLGTPIADDGLGANLIGKMP